MGTIYFYLTSQILLSQQKHFYSFQMIFGLLFVLLLILIYLYQYRRRSSGSIPFVKEGYYPLIGHLFVFVHNRTNSLNKSREKYGNIFEMKVLKQRFIFVTNPLDWPIVIRNPSFRFLGDLFSKRIFDMDHNFFGQSDLDVQLQKYFHEYLINSNELNRLNEQFVAHLVEYVHKEKEKWINVNLFEFCFDLLFNSITKTFYGDIQLESLKDSYRKFDLDIPYLFLLLPEWISRLIFPRVIKRRNELNQFWFDKIHLLNESQLVEHRTNLILNNEQFFSSNDYAGEKTFLLWSSLSNTIPTLFWSLSHLLTNEKTLKKIKDEIEENFVGKELNVSQIRSCKYLNSLINETLRMYSNPMIMRRALNDVQLKLHDEKEILIEKNAIIAFYPHLAQNADQYYSNADQFQFDRFVNEKMETARPFLPFGCGQSTCPGRFFAKNIIQLSIIILLQSIDFHVDDCLNIPSVNEQRQGIGVSHPKNELIVSMKCHLD